MNNIVLNIISRKQNLSYPLVFKKIAKYYWNKTQLCFEYDIKYIDIAIWVIKNKYFRMLDLFDKNQLLSSAVEYFDVFKYLVEKKNVDINNISLILSCEKNSLDTVKYIVEKGGDIHCYDEYPIRYACRHGNLDLVKFLVERGADYTKVSSYCSFSALENAISYDNTEVVDFLLKLKK